MCEASATPKDPANIQTPWETATQASVVETPINFDGNLPIIRVFWGATSMHITRDHYDKGVVLLNECPPPPANSATKTTKEIPDPGNEFKCIIVDEHTDAIDVIVPDNNGWPTGRIVIFRPKP